MMQRTLRQVVACVTATVLGTGYLSTTCEARGYRLMGEQNTSSGVAGNESVIYTYDTYANLLANNYSSFTATQINWGGGFATVGLAYDGVYRLMGEQDTDTSSAGQESYIYTYNSFADLVANNSSTFSATNINWGSGYATVGLVYDGVYRLMGERNTGSHSAGDESLIFTYDTFADLLANHWSSYLSTQIDWGGEYSTAGLAYDGVYRLMGETNTGSGTAGNESVIYTYDSFADLVANHPSNVSATQIDWSSPYATVALAVEQVSRCDLNSDGAVDAADAGILFAHWGPSTHFGLGDLNGDGLVDAADAGVCFGEWTGDAVPASVPEPASITLTWLAVMLHHAVRSRNRQNARQVA